MTDIFISHAQCDLPFAEFLYRHMVAEGFHVYLASTSMQLGEKWMPGIMENLRNSACVICLASRAACASPWVMQEMGGAVMGNKKVIPIVWDQSPENLPGWMKQYQAIDLAGANQQDVISSLIKIANSIKADKQKAGIIAAFLLAGIALFG